MAAKCVHKGCGKIFSEDEPCVYHPGYGQEHLDEQLVQVKLTGSY